MDEPKILDELPERTLKGHRAIVNPAMEMARANPGKWVTYTTGARDSISTRTAALRRGSAKSLDPSTHDVEWRLHADGTATIYIRYHGGQS